jgi:toxin-antitoxin system toxin component
MSSYYGILRLGIFGSVARGEQTEDSDLDVFVELQIPNPYILGDIKEDLEHMTGYKIDLIRLCDNLNKLLLQNIERDGIFA